MDNHNQSQAETLAEFWVKYFLKMPDPDNFLKDLHDKANDKIMLVEKKANSFLFCFNDQSALSLTFINDTTVDINLGIWEYDKSKLN